MMSHMIMWKKKFVIITAQLNMLMLLCWYIHYWSTLASLSLYFVYHTVCLCCFLGHAWCVSPLYTHLVSSTGPCQCTPVLTLSTASPAAQWPHWCPHKVLVGSLQVQCYSSPLYLYKITCMVWHVWHVSKSNITSLSMCQTIPIKAMTAMLLM